MARKKTKAQKKKTVTRRSQTTPNHGLTYTLDLSEEEMPTVSTKKKTSQTQGIMYEYDPSLILGDLRKTIFLSIFMFGLIFGVYFMSQQGLLPFLI